MNPTSPTSINWTLKNSIFEVRLQQEPCNEIGTRMLDGWERFLKEAASSKASAVILYSGLSSGFCAGADLRESYQGMLAVPKKKHESLMREFIDRIHHVMDTLDMLPMTTIGVIHGACFGGGFELALTCDLLIAEESARFCFPELRLGIIPCFGGIPRLKREVGNALIRDLLFTGRSINAKKAQTVGLVSQVVADGKGLEVARQMAVQTAKFNNETRIAAKKFIKPLPKEELAKEKDLFLSLFQRPAYIEALRKFVESNDLRPYLP